MSEYAYSPFVRNMQVARHANAHMLACVVTWISRVRVVSRVII